MTERLGIGPHAMWGFSPALDLLDTYLSHHPADAADASSATTTPPLNAKGDEAVRPINVLLVNPNDIRHVLRTIAVRRRHFKESSRPRPVHFYIWDRPIEALARHLALLQVARDYSLPVRQRANLWLEVFGNTLVQERTALYIEALGKEMVRLVCGDGDKAGAADLIDLSLLKFRERDALEATFKTWAVKVPYDVASLRDARLRHFYGQRYDSRNNVADWDYHEGVKPVASIIHYKQFRDWRRTGVAFEFGDQTYTNPNRTMASYAEGQICKGKDRGFKKEVRGYWLDIVVGPYAAVGVDCDKPNKFAEDLFLIHNKGTGTEQHRHHAVEVAVYNMLSYLYEIENGEVYQMTREHDIFSGLGREEEEEEVSGPKTTQAVEGQSAATKEEEEEEVQEEERVVELSPEEFDRQMKLQRQREAEEQRGVVKGKEEEEEGHQKCKETDEAAPAHRLTPEQEIKVQECFSGIKVTLLGDEFRALYTKKRFQGLFDVVSLSVGASHFLGDKDIANLFSPTGASIHVENVKYMPPMNKAAKIEYVNKVKTMASEIGLVDDFGKKKRSIEDLKLRDDLPYVWTVRLES